MKRRKSMFHGLYLAVALGFFALANAASAQTLNFDEMVRQSSSIDTGIYPHGVPESYSWYNGDPLPRGAFGPPPEFTSLAGWGQVYPQRFVPHAKCNIYMKGYQTWAHKKTGGWLLVEDTTRGFTIGGGYFVADFKDNAGYAASIQHLPTGEQRFESPPTGYTIHWWTQPRGTYPANTIDGALTLFALRTDNTACNLVTNAGLDYWRTPTAPYIHPPGTNNPAYGAGAWMKLTTSYQYIYFTRFSRQQLIADPPPPFQGSVGGDVTAPNVAIASPQAGGTLSGTVNLSANASDNVGVVGVQFYVDGIAVGAEDSSAPYSVSLNSASLANGSHSLTARARDAAGNTKVSAAVTVNVSNSGSGSDPGTGSGTGSSKASPNTLLGTTMPIHTVGAVQGQVYNLWSNGTLSQYVSFSASQIYKISVEAYGSPAGGVYPTMQVLVDDRVMGTMAVNSTTAKVFSVSASIGSGMHKIGVAFTNDANINGQDRNLFIKRIVIEDGGSTSPTRAVTPSLLSGKTMPLHTTGAVQGEAYNIWSNGSLSRFVSFSAAGSYRIAVDAYGSPAGGVYPTMQVLVDDRVVGTTVVSSTGARVYEFTAEIGAGSHKIGVAFTNDANINGQDRNLYIRTISLSPN